jgi:hypothetical protein
MLFESRCSFLSMGIGLFKSLLAIAHTPFCPCPLSPSHPHKPFPRQKRAGMVTAMLRSSPKIIKGPRGGIAVTTVSWMASDGRPGGLCRLVKFMFRNSIYWAYRTFWAVGGALTHSIPPSLCFLPRFRLLPCTWFHDLTIGRSPSYWAFIWQYGH